MPQPERMPGLMQRHRVEVHVGPAAPRLISIQVEIAGDSLGVRRSGIKSMRQRSTWAVEWVAVAVRTAGEQDVQRPFGPLLLARRQGEIGVPGPLTERPFDFRP